MKRQQSDDGFGQEVNSQPRMEKCNSASRSDIPERMRSLGGEGAIACSIKVQGTRNDEVDG